jgi:N-methylhydantoinase B
MAVRAGDTFICEGPAGGGYGPPWERAPEKVAADVADGLMTAETARERFGVALRPDGMVDEAGTTALRHR